MTAHQGYIWFLPSWYVPDWWDVDFYNSRPSHSDPRPQESVPCTTEVRPLSLTCPVGPQWTASLPCWPPSAAFFSLSQIVAAVELVCSVSLLVPHGRNLGSSVSAIIRILLCLERCYCCKISVPVLVHLFDMYLQDFDMMWIVF